MKKLQKIDKVLLIGYVVLFTLLLIILLVKGTQTTLFETVLLGIWALIMVGWGFVGVYAGIKEWRTARKEKCKEVS